MSTNESRNGAVYIVSISMTLKSTTTQLIQETKTLLQAEFSDGPEDIWRLVYSRLLPVIQSNTNLCPAIKEFCRHNLGLKSDREIGWS